MCRVTSCVSLAATTSKASRWNRVFWRHLASASFCPSDTHATVHVAMESDAESRYAVALSTPTWASSTWSSSRRVNKCLVLDQFLVISYFTICLILHLDRRWHFNFVVVCEGEQEIPGLTDATVPRRLGPKRASKIRKLFNLKKEDDVRQYVVRRPLPAKEGLYTPNTSIALNLFRLNLIELI